MNRWIRVSMVIALCGAALSCSSDGLLIPIALPTLSAIGTTAVMQGATATVALAGTNFVPGATTVVVSGTGVTVSSVAVNSPTSASATLAIASTAPIGAHTVAVVTVAGTSAAMSLMVNPPPPTLTTLLPTAGVQGTTVPVTLTGTNFVAGATTMAVSGTGVSVRNVSVTNATIVTADFFIDAGAALADRTVTVATAGGTSSPQTFTIKAPPPTLASLSAPIGVTGTIVTQTLTGTNFIPGATVVVTGSGVTVTNVAVVSATSITAQFTLSADAALGTRAVTVLTSGGVSGAATFTVNPPAPTVGSITPNSGVRGTAVAVTISGTNFVSGATTVAISGTGVAAGNVSVVSGTSLTTTFTIDETAALGDRTVTITTAGGAGATQTFTVLSAAPTLASVSPAAGVSGQAPAVTLIGTGFVPGATTVAAGAGVTVLNVNVTSNTSLTAILSVDANAALGDHAVTVTTAGGTSNPRSFTVLASAPVLAGVTPNIGAQGGTQTITLTGANFRAGATTVSVSGSNVTASSVTVTSSAQLTATFDVAPGAALSARNVTVTTTGGTSGAQPFTVVVPPTINAFNALATHLTAVQPARLRWTTSNAATCSISNGIGIVSNCNDSVFVTPGTTKTYTLSATRAGATVTANVQLFANEPGRFVYWTSSGGAAGTHVHQFALDATTGDLTAIGAGTVASGNGSQGIAVDPSGRYAYVANSTSDNVSMYSIDPTTGALTSRGTQPAGNDPREVVVDPTGRFAFVINNNAGGIGSISRYTIDGTGLLVGNGTTTLGTNSTGIAIDGTGRFLYATNRTSKTIQEFSINADGTLSSLGTVPTSGFFAYYIAADPAGRFLYLTHDTDGRYSQYRIEADGTLTLLGGPVNIGPGTERPVTVDPTGRFAYIADFNNAILHEFAVDPATAILTRFAAPTLPHTLPTTQTLQQFAIDPQGKFAYGTDQNNSQILLFTIDANGVLAPVTAPLRTIPGGTNPFGIVVSR